MCLDLCVHRCISNRMYVLLSYIKLWFFSSIELKSSFGLDHIIQAKRHFKIKHIFSPSSSLLCVSFGSYTINMCTTVCNVALTHRHQMEYTSPIVKLISIRIQISMVSLVSNRFCTCFFYLCLDVFSVLSALKNILNNFHFFIKHKENIQVWFKFR